MYYNLMATQAQQSFHLAVPQMTVMKQILTNCIISYLLITKYNILIIDWDLNVQLGKKTSKFFSLNFSNKSSFHSRTYSYAETKFKKKKKREKLLT